MIETQTYISAFIIGLLGGVHCAGMCGGIMGALTLGTDIGKNKFSLFTFITAYNLARITSYVVAGIIFGSLGATITDLTTVNNAQLILKVIASLFLIALGLYLASWWRGLIAIEQMGNIVWKKIEPLARRCIPIRNMSQALIAGFTWGWLPCGLVYSVLIWSLSSGGAVEGGFLMLSFGLGTLPNLLLIGFFSSTLTRYFQNSIVRAIAGLIIIIFGVIQLTSAISSF